MKKLFLSLFILIGLQMQAQCWKEVAAGELHTVAIANNGSLWTWGDDTFGQLGYEIPTPLPLQYTPKQVGTATDWKKVDAGFWLTLVQKNDGTLWACGHSSSMSINLAQTLYQVNPDTDWKSFSCGPYHTILIKNDGTLWGWGENSFGSAGVGSTNNAILVPTQIGTENNWKSVSAGGIHALAVKTDGTLWTWGGIFRNGQNEKVLSPIQIGTDTDWEAVSGAGSNSAAIKTNGTIWVWGKGSSGNGSQVDLEIPTQVGTDIWQNIETGMGTFHGVKVDGTLWGWGYNDIGQIGNGESGSAATINTSSPVLIYNEAGWKAIGTKGFFTAFLNSNGTLKMCGGNGARLGLGFMLNVLVIPTPTVVTCDIAGLNENTLSQITLYPNPTSNVLNLANAENSSIESLKVIDVTGKTLLQQTGNTTQLDVQQLPTGMYFLEVSANGNKQHYKFIKE